ncbi:MAG TPA: hypothetical protein VGB11_08205 [Candidatus Bathyarchaeia archaeon]|jgi:predicted nucleic acid-binding protein
MGTNQITEKVYIDTNILVSYALGPNDDGYLKAKNVFDQAVKENHTIMVSNFMLTEALNTLRNVITEDKYQSLAHGVTQTALIAMADSEDFKKDIADESMKSFSDVIDLMTRDSQHFKFEENTKYDGVIFQNSLALLSGLFGIFRVYRFRCDKCEQYNPCSTCRTTSSIVYKAINAPDLLHVQIAQTLGCTKFVTMDKGFGTISKVVQIPITVLQ